MVSFALAAALLVAVALAFLLPPLLRRAPNAGVSIDAANVSVYRDQLADLEADVKRGVLSADQLAQARTEIERRLADDLRAADAPVSAPRSARWVALSIAIAVPAVAVVVYGLLGNPTALDPEKRLGMTEQQAAGRDKMIEMTAKLEARMQAKPDDPLGWAMLGRAYRMMGKMPDAQKAFARSVALKGDDAEVLADYAEVLAVIAGRLDGDALKLAQRALAVDGRSEKALALLGTGAFDAEDYKGAIGYWERLLALAPPGSEYAQAITGAITEARAKLTTAAGPQRKDAAAPGPKIAGTVALAPALATEASPDDAVFVFARAEQGPRMPLAVQRFKVRDLPAAFSLDDSMAMAPGMNLSKFPRVVVGARISKSGSATPQPGDLEGSTGAVEPGAKGVKLVIDRKTP